MQLLYYWITVFQYRMWSYFPLKKIVNSFGDNFLMQVSTTNCECEPQVGLLCIITLWCWQVVWIFLFLISLPLFVNCKTSWLSIANFEMHPLCTMYMLAHFCQIFCGLDYFMPWKMSTHNHNINQARTSILRGWKEWIPTNEWIKLYSNLFQICQWRRGWYLHQEWVLWILDNLCSLIILIDLIGWLDD